VNSLPKTVARPRRGCDLNPGPSAPESSMLTTRLPSHPLVRGQVYMRLQSKSEKLEEYSMQLKSTDPRFLFESNVMTP